MDPAPSAVGADPRRPRRTWYAVAALIAAGGVLAAAVVLLLVPSGGDLGQRITPGQPVTVHVPEGGLMVWGKDVEGEIPGVRCEPSPADTEVLEEWSTARMLFDDLTLTADGERWRGLLLVRARPTGTYAVSCTIPGADTTLSLGDPPRFHGPVPGHWRC